MGPLVRRRRVRRHHVRLRQASSQDDTDSSLNTALAFFSPLEDLLDTPP